MRKIFAIAFGVVVITSMASCKKDYTCTCTTTTVGIGVATYNSTITDTKDGAKTKCDQGDVSTIGVETNCEIK
jgi:hypothetical protein